MQFDASTPRVEFTINKQTFTCPAPFAQGHVCTAGEAAQLNQVIRENVRNNLGAKEGDEPLTQEKVDAYLQKYEMGARQGGTIRLDPVERKARSIAEERLRARLTIRGETLSKENFNNLRDQLAARPEIVAAAKKALADAARAGADLIDELIASAPPPAQAQPEAVQAA